MSKLLELVVILVLLTATFFFGASYSKQVKENFNWLFEVKEQEVEIPKLQKSKDLKVQQNPVIINEFNDIDKEVPENIEDNIVYPDKELENTNNSQQNIDKNDSNIQNLNNINNQQINNE